MTKNEIIEVLSTMVVDIIGEKDEMYTKLEKLVKDNKVIEGKENEYHEWEKKFEWLNGQQNLIGSQVEALKLNKHKFYDAVNEKDLHRIRSKKIRFIG